MTNIVKVAVIGYGYWGPNVLKALSETESCEVVMCCDFKDSKLEIVKKRYPSIKTTTNANEIFNDNSIDAVVISSPLVTHYPLAKQSLNSKKHVWIEKPMTENSTQAKQLIRIANKNKKIIFVDHIFLYTQAVTYLKKIIDAGNLGKIYYFDSTRINLGIFQPDNNVVWDLATHDISIMCHVLGITPKAISAYGSCHIKPGVEDMAYINVTFNKNISAHISVSWLSPVKIRRTLIAGSKKMVTYDDLETSEKIKIYDYGVSSDKTYRPESSTTGHQYRTGDINSPAIENKEALHTAARHFIDCIKSGTQPLSNGLAGYKVIKILEATSKSLKQNGKKQSIFL